MDKGKKRRRSTTSHLRSKDIVSSFADPPTMDKTGKHLVEKLSRPKFSTIYVANIDDDRFRSPPSFVKNVRYLFLSSISFILSNIDFSLKKKKMLYVRATNIIVVRLCKPLILASNYLKC